jgi:multidrug resistance efflux pump
MFTAIFSVILLGFIALVGSFVIERPTYGSSLEQYITSHNPQHSGDVERLTVEYNQKVSRGLL